MAGDGDDKTDSGLGLELRWFTPAPLPRAAAASSRLRAPETEGHLAPTFGDRDVLGRRDIVECAVFVLRGADS